MKSSSKATQPTAPPSILFFDLEIRRHASEVGGWENKAKMGISVAVALECPGGVVHFFTEPQIRKLKKLLSKARWIVGYNIRNFDFEVLKGCGIRIPKTLRCLDMMEEIDAKVSRRCSLDELLKSNFGTDSQATGMDCLRLWKRRRMLELTEACLNDVMGMQRLFFHGVSTGRLKLPGKNGKGMMVKLDWQRLVPTRAGSASRRIC